MKGVIFAGARTLFPACPEEKSIKLIDDDGLELLSHTVIVVKLDPVRLTELM